MCSSFPLLSAPHFLFSIWTDLIRSEKIPGAPTWRWGEWIWLYWALRVSSKFTTGVKYQFHQGFWPDQRSGNPNNPSPPHIHTQIHTHTRWKIQTLCSKWVLNLHTLGPSEQGQAMPLIFQPAGLASGYLKNQILLSHVPIITSSCPDK